MSALESFGTDLGMELGWEDEIQQDSQESIKLAEGDYDFEVAEFERARFNGSEKVPPCNQAKLKLKVETPEGMAVVFHNMFLNTKFEWQLSAFFCAIGQKRRGEPLKMNWNNVVGAKGRARIGVREYDGKTYNQIKKFYDAPETTPPAAAPKTFKSGSF